MKSGQGQSQGPRERGNRGKKGTARLFVLGAALAASATGTVSATPLQEPTGEPSIITPRGRTRQADGIMASSHASRRLMRDERPSGPAALELAQATTSHRFAIAAGPLTEVLAAFEQVTGVKPVFSIASLGTLPSPGVTGVFTVQAALQRLLEGTAVTFRVTGPTSVVLEIGGQTDSVDVYGRLSAVQSPKYPVRLRDVAQTIAVIPRTVIEAQGATTLSETLRNVPGITLQAGEGGGASSTSGDMFNMRGFNASNSLFVDGVRDDGLISRDVFNLEQVEVFMGPTGSDVGRGTAAGYVNMQTKAPHLVSTHAVTLGVGTAGQKRVSADVNVPFGAGRGDSWLSKSALRVNVLSQDSGVPGRDEVSLDNKAIAPSLGLGLSTRTRVSLGAQIVRQNNLPDYGIPGAAWREAPLTSTTVLAPAPVKQSNYYGSADLDYDKASQDSYTGRVEHDINRRFTLRNQIRYNQTHRTAVVSAIQSVGSYNAATNLVTIARQGNERENSITSNQTNLIGRFSTGRLRHASSLGVEVSSEHQFAPTLTGLGTRAPVNIFAPNTHDPVTGFALARTGASSTGESTTAALYAFDTIELNDRWQISGGLRWERYHTTFRSVDASGATTANITGSEGLISGKAGVLFRVASAGNVYVSYGSSATPPGSANFTLSTQTNNQNNPNVKPQLSTNYEVGTKWDLGQGRLSLSGSVFRTENTNVIFTVDATSVPPLFNQDDGQRVNGVTAGVMGRITDRWEVLANIGYLDTELQSQNVANNGKRLTLTPTLSGSFWTTYRLPHGLTVGGGVRHIDSVFINAANTIKSPGYKVADAVVEYAVNSHVSLRANIYNLANERYIKNVNNNGGRYNPGQTRSAVVTTNIKL